MYEDNGVPFDFEDIWFLQVEWKLVVWNRTFLRDLIFDGARGCTGNLASG